jgi:hypothetical protein
MLAQGFSQAEAPGSLSKSRCALKGQPNWVRLFAGDALVCRSFRARVSIEPTQAEALG